MLAAELVLSVAAWDLEVLAAELSQGGHQVVTCEVDTADEAAVRRGLEKSVAALGSCSFLVNNAGPAQDSELGSRDGVAKALSSYGSSRRLRLAAPGSNGGTVVNVASVAGNLQGTGAQPWYSAAKAGIAGYTRWLATKRPNGIRANAILPAQRERPRGSTPPTEPPHRKNPDGPGRRAARRRAGSPVPTRARIGVHQRRLPAGRRRDVPRVVIAGRTLLDAQVTAGLPCEPC